MVIIFYNIFRVQNVASSAKILRQQEVEVNVSYEERGISSQKSKELIKFGNWGKFSRQKYTL